EGVLSGECSGGGVHRVDEPIAIENGISNVRPAAFRADNLPTAVVRDELHLTTGAPPLVKFAWQRVPDIIGIADFSKVGQQRFVDLSRFRVNQIIRMAQKTHQAVALKDHRYLFFPETNGIIFQDIENRVVLRGREGNLENFADKIRHDSAATASLRLKVSYVGDRHVIGEFERVEPIEIAVHCARAKSPGTTLRGVVIDEFGAARKLNFVVEKVPIMIEIVHVEFET